MRFNSHIIPISLSSLYSTENTKDLTGRPKYPRFACSSITQKSLKQVFSST